MESGSEKLIMIHNSRRRRDTASQAQTGGSVLTRRQCRGGGGGGGDDRCQVSEGSPWHTLITPICALHRGVATFSELPLAASDSGRYASHKRVFSTGMRLPPIVRGFCGGPALPPESRSRPGVPFIGNAFSGSASASASFYVVSHAGRLMVVLLGVLISSSRGKICIAL